MARCPRNSTATALAALAAAFAVLVLASTAEAGTYRVSTCQFNPPTTGNHSFEVHNAGPYPAELRDECGSSTRRLDTKATGHWSAGWVAGWKFTAPDGTTLRSIDYKADGAQNNSAFVPILSTDRGVLESCVHLGGCGWSSDKRGVSLGGAQFVFAGLYCSSGGPSNHCYLDTNPAGHPLMSLFGATIEVEDPSGPAITNRRGYIDSQTTVRGEADVVFDAGDNVGILSAELRVDERGVDRKDYPCDYAQARPCSDVTGARLAFDSRRVPNGTHVVKLIVRDAAQNETTYTETITVANPPPPERRDSSSGSGRSGGGGGGGSGGGGSGAGGSSSTGSGFSDSAAVLGAAHWVALWVRPSRVRNGRSVRFLGRAAPAVAGTLIVIQARVGRGWRTFATAQTDAFGRFSTAYRFTRTRRTQRYHFRAVVPAQLGLASAGAGSRPVSVLVTR